MKVLMTGSSRKELGKAVADLFQKNGHHCHGVSRSNGYNFDLNPSALIKDIVELSVDYDVFVNLYSNHSYNASVLLHKLFMFWREKNFSNRRIINISSTTDRVKKGKMNIYHYEKRALRDLSAGLSISSVWGQAPKVTYISFGTMENRASDHPGRKVMGFNEVARYIYWITQQPTHLHINELSIDPIQ